MSNLETARLLAEITRAVPKLDPAGLAALRGLLAALIALAIREGAGQGEQPGACQVQRNPN